MNENVINHISYEYLMNKAILEKFIYQDMSSNYYWSSDWSCEFYIELAYAGFISISHKYENSSILLPEIQFEYALLDFDDLHIPKKVKTLLKKDDFKFTFNTKFEKVINSISNYHKDSWLSKEYVLLLKNLKNYKNNRNFQIVSVEISSIKSDNLIAGEIGYIIGQTYTSLTGFFDKSYNNYGKLQLVLLANYLNSNGFVFWNLGHPYMKYKANLGAKIYSRDKFLKKWIKYRDK